MQETLVRFLGWGDPLEKGMAINFSILDWQILMHRRALWATVHGVAKSQTQLKQLSTQGSAGELSIYSSQSTG